MQITIPWPDPKLSPNARCHYLKVATLKKQYRSKCCEIAYRHGGKMSGTLHLTITFHPPDKRKRDIDNMLASIKSGLDGIADAIEVDDYNWVITIQRAEPVSGGAINIGISKHELDG